LTEDLNSTKPNAGNWMEALLEIEQATRALHSLDLGNPSRNREILASRSRALSLVAALCSTGLGSLPESERAGFRERLDQARQSGDLAAARLIALKQKAGGEWSRWNHIRQSLDPARRTSPNRLNCKG